MIAVWIQFTECMKFREFEFLYKMESYMVIINVVLNSPINEIIPHLDGLFDIELTSPKESEQVHVVKLVGRNFLDGLNMGSEFGKDLKLLLGTIARES